MQGLITFFTNLFSWLLTQLNAFVPVLGTIAVVWAAFQILSGIFGDDPRKVKSGIFTIIGTVIAILIIKFGADIFKEGMHAGGIGFAPGAISVAMQGSGLGLGVYPAHLALRVLGLG